MYRLRAFGQSSWRRIKAAIQIFEKLQTTTYINFDLLENRSQITYWKTVIAFVLGNHRIRNKYEQKNTLHIQNKSNYIYLWWKEKGTALFLLNVQSKSADFCCFHRHIENEATTMQRNRSAHTAWAALVWSTLCIKATLFPQRQQGRNDSDRFLGLQLECQHVPMFLFTAQKYYLNIPVLRVSYWWQ